jgi:hypothetical protein
VLYRCVQEHLETWLAQCRDGDYDAGAVPAYVEREFRRYLECGILAHGFARAPCGQCGHDFLIAFSCKGRGVCPSYNARRMVETAAHLTDHVLPELPLRQWVLAVPKRLRYFLERDADLQGAALQLFLRAVESCLRAHSPGASAAARLGAVAFIHRFGSNPQCPPPFSLCRRRRHIRRRGGRAHLPRRQLPRCHRHRRRAGRSAPAAVARVRAPRPAAGR